MTAIIERQRERLYTQKAKKLQNVFIYKKLDTFQKARQFPLRFLNTKSHTIYVTAFSCNAKCHAFCILMPTSKIS